MRLVMVLLCLAVIVSSPLLKKAEAATNLARALDAISPLSEDHQVPDGTIDDDNEEMGLRSRGRGEAGSDLSPFLNPRTVVDSLLSPVLPPSPLYQSASPCRSRQAPWLSQRTSQRQAWLQHFLF